MERNVKINFFGLKPVITDELLPRRACLGDCNITRKRNMFPRCKFSRELQRVGMQGGIYPPALRCEHIGRLLAITKHCRHAHTAYRKEKAGERLLRKGHSLPPRWQRVTGTSWDTHHLGRLGRQSYLPSLTPPSRLVVSRDRHAVGTHHHGRRCDRRAAASRVIVVQGWTGWEGQTTTSPRNFKNTKT